MTDSSRRGSQTAVAAGFVLAVLTGLALAIRLALDLDGALDVDTVAFALSVVRFDPVHHQPQPPGYPGYVLGLKAIHALWPWLDPLEVAKWGSRLCGTATVPLSFLACRAIGANQDPASAMETPGPESLIRALAAALFAAVHPLLWYYGSDGQVHAAEGMVTLALVIAAARARRRPGWAGAVALGAVFGLAGSVRSNIPLLGVPWFVWALWRRSLREGTAAVVAGAVVAIAWMLPTVLASGGLDLYLRANRALLVEHIARHFSPLGAGFSALSLLNLARAAYGMGLASVPLLAWGRRPGAWRRPFVATMLVSAVFYGLGFVSEPGYFAGVAALACLTPATWPRADRAAVGLKVRAAIAFLAGPCLVLAGPAQVSLPGLGAVWVPSAAHVIEVERLQAFYRERVCEAAGGRPALVVTDHPNPLLMRILPRACPGVLAVSYRLGGAVDPDLEDLHMFGVDRVWTLPAEVPLEQGPPGVLSLPFAVERVIVAPFASEAIRDSLRTQASCGPLASGISSGPPLLVWPARCLSPLRLGPHRLLNPGRPQSREEGTGHRIPER